MKITATLLLTLISTTAIAAERVPVKTVEPIVRNEVTRGPVQNCSQVPVHRSNRQPSGGAVGALSDSVFGSTGGLAGAVIGGVIGHQIGKGRGQDLATGVGVIIGSQIGDKESQKESGGDVVYQTRCTTEYRDHLIPTVVGYRVTFIYNGREETTVLNYNPGQYVTVERPIVVR